MGFIKTDRLKEVLESINGLVKKEVLVGIPDSRPEDTKKPITKAQIAYILDGGSPANNIPARPFLVPGVASVQGRISVQLGKAADAALGSDLAGAEKRMGGAGQIAVDAVKLRINSNIQPALSEATLEDRRRRGVTRENTLVDTGEMRDAVTYVIRKKG